MQRACVVGVGVGAGVGAGAGAGVGAADAVVAVVVVDSDVVIQNMPMSTPTEDNSCNPSARGTTTVGHRGLLKTPQDPGTRKHP